MSENVGSQGYSTIISIKNLLSHVKDTRQNPSSRTTKSQVSLPSYHMDTTILPFQPFRLKLLHTLLNLAQDPDPTIALHLQQGFPSGAFAPLEPIGLWEPNNPPDVDQPDLQVCQDNWKSANQDPSTTRFLIQQLDAGFIEEIPSIAEAQRRWPKGIAWGKLGVVCADNRDPRLVLDSTICGMNGRCHLPEKPRLPNLRHVSFFLSTCPPFQDEWQGASVDIKAAHKRILIREEERGALLFQFEQKIYAYRTAHFKAKTSAWHWGRVSGALLRLIRKLLFFRHAACVYVDDFLFLFPASTAHVQFTLAVILLRALGAPLSWKKLEFDSSIEWNGWSIQPAIMTAQPPKFKLHKNTSLIHTLLEHPCRKNLEKIIGIILWATSLVHHTRFLLTSLYKDLFSIPATNYSIPPTQWEYFLNILNGDVTISVSNNLYLPVGARVVEFKHSTITSKAQLPSDIPMERHAWVRLRDPSTGKRKLSDESKQTLKWILTSLLPLLSSIPLNRFCPLTINAAADAFADEESMGMRGWVNIQSSKYWFSQIWSTKDLEIFLLIKKALQRYITSWEALAQLCINITVFQKCETRPGIIHIQSGSDNTGAEAYINHGFSTTLILADMIKLVSIKQLQYNSLFHIHHIPGEKNVDADNLSRCKVSDFSDTTRVTFELQDIFDQPPFPRYINNLVQWDSEIHPFAKFVSCCFVGRFFSPLSFVPFLLLHLSSFLSLVFSLFFLTSRSNTYTTAALLFRAQWSPSQL